MTDEHWFGVGVVILMVLMFWLFPMLVTRATVADRLASVAVSLRKLANRWRQR